MKAIIKLWDSVGTGLIIKHSTGVIVTNQTGGTSCLQPEEEGIFVPFANDYSTDNKFLSMELELSKIFEDSKYKGTGAILGIDSEDKEQINSLLKQYKLFDWIEVDSNMLKQSHEAWIYVIIKANSQYSSGFAPYPKQGVLTWANSD